MKAIEFTGVWWVPTSPSNRVSGILKFEQPEWPRLELIGAFEPSFSKRTQFHDVILGISTDGKLITVTGCNESGRTFASVGVESTKYIGSFVLVGKHFPRSKDIRFSKARLDLTHLFEWIDNSAVEQHFESSPRKLVKFSHSVPDEIEFPTGLGSFRCKFGVATRHAGPAHTLDENRWIEISANRPRQIEKYLHDLIQPFQHFLSLGTGQPTFIEEFVVELPNGKDSFKAYFAQRSYRPIRKPVLPTHMLFTLGHIHEKRNSILKKWFKATGKMREVRLLFHDVERTPEMFLHHKFLSLMQAVETYHARRLKNEIVPKSEHALRLKRIRQSCPIEFRPWLNDRLGNSNSKTLRMRLTELTSRYKALLHPIVADFEWFNQKLRDTRNYFTHYNSALENKALDGAALLWNVERLTILLKACLLKDLGLTVPAVTELFQKDPSYIHLKTVRTYYSSD